MVPPRSASPATMCSWSAIVEITGSGVSGSNSAELASVEPDRAGRLDHDALQSQAQAQDRHARGARACRMAPILPSMPRMPKPPGISTPCTSPSAAAAPAGVSQSSDGTQTHARPSRGGEPAGPQRLGDRQVGIGAGQHTCRPRQFALSRAARAPGEQVVPLGPVDVAERQAEPAHHIGVEFLAVQHLGDVVDRRRVRGGDDAVDIDVAHQRDLVFQRLGHIAVAAQDQRVRA